MGVFQRKVSESPRKVQNVRQLTTKIRQEVFQKECFLLDLFVWQKNKPPARQVEGVALASSKNLL